MKQQILATKAKTLENLTDKLERFQIPNLIWFTVGDWRSDPDAVLEEVRDTFSSKRKETKVQLAVRSSAIDEDGREAAMAGEFDSVLNVPSGNTEAIRKAVETVAESYQRNGAEDEKNEIIVQRMLEEMSMSGVVFTHDLNTGAPYYVINYDDVSGKTDTVTSGGGEHANRTLYIHRGAVDAIRSERFQSLVAAIRELEDVMDSEFLDIEFAMGSDLVPQLLQVRAITTQPNWNRAVSKRINAALDGIQDFVRQRFRPMDGVFGETTVLGQMPDWNPAEMIGRAPRNLAFSLYETLITNRAWCKARQMMDYAIPSGQPLMVSLAGQPYIDTRFSFHSYLPADLSPEIGEKLVNVWLDRLREHPHLHDKVEFDVAITTYSFDIDEKLDQLTGGALDNTEMNAFKNALHRLTLDLVRGRNAGGIGPALERIALLEEKQEQEPEITGKVELASLFRMIDDCIRFGTLPFSILARHGFIARSLLLSLRSRGIFSAEEVQQFQSGIRTVAGELVDDMMELQTGSLSRSDFMKRYGHLRPGTYDILSLRYDQIDDFGSGSSLPRPDQPREHSFEPSGEQIRAIDRLLDEENFDGVNAESLLEYIRQATAGREYGKFVFTRTVSEMLELIARFGEQNGLSREEISHISIQDILREAVASGEGTVEDRLRRISEEGAEQHVVCSAIRLPQILYDEEGVHVVPFQVSLPNFITDKRVDSECVWLQTGVAPPPIAGKIVLIESADPGFDWIFAHKIAGLITKYGGANSHMAIRCAEFGIPAAIGCGEQKFERVVRASKISLDCSAGMIQMQF